MKHLNLITSIVATLLITACNGSVSSSSGTASASSSSSSGADGNQVSLSGTSGHAELAADRIDLKDGFVLVNDVSFGPAPPSASVNTP